MKSLLLLLAAAIASASFLALGQSPSPSPAAGALSSPAPGPAPRPAGSPGNPEASSVPLPDQPAGPTLEKTMPLMPETAPGGARAHGMAAGEAHPHAGPSATPHGTFEVEQDIRLHIRIRQAETRAQNDPAIHADWVAAHVPRTDPERRTALTTYYNHFYARVIQIDPSLAAAANARRQADIARMQYLHLGEGELPVEADPLETSARDADPGGKNPPPSEEPPLP